MKKALILLTMLGLLCASACQQQEAGSEEAAAVEQEESTENQTETAEATLSYDCAQCGMPSKDFPKWNTKITLADGTEKWTCSPRCMFILTKGETPLEGVQAVEVVDYYETKNIDGMSAFYVIKSSQTGPMGHDFVPCQTKEAAEEFLKDYNGERILRYQEVTQEVIQEVVNYQPE